MNIKNADFDGDALNGMIILDNETYSRLKRLEPHLAILDLKSPRQFSKNIKLPSPVVSTISNWILDERQQPVVK